MPGWPGIPGSALPAPWQPSIMDFHPASDAIQLEGKPVSSATWSSSGGAVTTLPDMNISG